jgi:hypothetical protein
MRYAEIFTKLLYYYYGILCIVYCAATLSGGCCKLRNNRLAASRQTIIALEVGEHTPSFELASRITTVFRVSIGEVFECKKESENDSLT